MARGLADLGALAGLIPSRGYLHGEKPTSVDAGIYGFIANIYFYDIDTPLRQLVTAHGNSAALPRHSLQRQRDNVMAANPEGGCLSSAKNGVAPLSC